MNYEQVEEYEQKIVRDFNINYAITIYIFNKIENNFFKEI